MWWRGSVGEDSGGRSLFRAKDHHMEDTALPLHRRLGELDVIFFSKHSLSGCRAIVRLPAFLTTRLYSSSKPGEHLLMCSRLACQLVCRPRRSPAKFASTPYQCHCYRAIGPEDWDKNWLLRGGLCASGSLREGRRGMIATWSVLDMV